MIKTRKETKSITEDVVEDIICNKCGKSLKDSCDMNYEGLTEARICGGYASKIGDMLELSFSLCEKCLIELFKTFVIKPSEVDHLGWPKDVQENQEDERCCKPTDESNSL